MNAVKTILVNEKYTGNMSWGKVRDWSNKRRAGKADPTVVQEAHEAIINEELWNKVQAVNVMKSETPNNQSNFKGEFILTGLLRCPVCGAGTVMSKSKKRDGSGYHLYYMCQTYHSKGKTECGSNLIKKEIVEEQVLKWIRTMLADEQIVDGIMNRLKREESVGAAELEKDLNIQQISLKKLLDKQQKQDTDYYAGEIRAALYNRLSEEVEDKINEVKQVLTYLEREIEKLQSNVILNKDIIVDALKNFEGLFEEATNEEKRALLRALIKEIHMEADRKSIKNIVFWFTEDDSFMESALPVSDVRRTLPQITANFFEKSLSRFGTGMASHGLGIGPAWRRSRRKRAFVSFSGPQRETFACGKQTILQKTKLSNSLKNHFRRLSVVASLSIMERAVFHMWAVIRGQS